MKEALVILCVTEPLTVGAFLWILIARERAERAERAALLNRIQSPESVVYSQLEESEPAVVFDDDEAELAAIRSMNAR